MRDAAGVDVASINGYVLLRGRGQHAVLADAADDADGELVNAVTALFSRSAGHLDASHLKSGAWHGYRMSGDGKLDVAGHKAALLGQLRYFQSGGFRRLGRSKFLARASDPADASRRAPVEDYYEEAYGAGKEVAAETSEAIIDEEIARATAAGLTGNALLLAWRSRARERELATMPQSTREKELAEVARLRARYPAVCTQSEADGAPVFMLIGAPDWFYKMSAARISARSSGGSGTSPGIGGGSTVPRQW